jgi:hypothetical protein
LLVHADAGLVWGPFLRGHDKARTAGNKAKSIYHAAIKCVSRPAVPIASLSRGPSARKLTELHANSSTDKQQGYACNGRPIVHRYDGDTTAT